jgi:AcrR family transcriptional regulator
MSQPARPSRSRRRVPAAPGTRRARKKARTRGEIFAAAMRLFGERGFDEVTIEQICGAADVARGTFFLHFPSKAALLFEFSRQLARDLEGLLREPRGSALSEYGRMVEHFGDRWLRHADVMRAMLREFLASPEALAAAGSEGRDLLELVEGIVQRGQQRGEFRRNVSARLAAAMFLQTAAAILSGAVYRGRDVTPEQVRNEFLHALLHGLLEPKPRVKWAPPAHPSPGAGR